MKKKVRKSSNSINVKLVLAFVIVVILVLGFVFINNNVLTGNAILDKDNDKVGSNVPLTWDQLRRGVTLSEGVNIITWTNEIDENVPIERVFGLLPNVELVEGITQTDYKKRWAGLASGYGKDTRNNEYSKNAQLLEELRPGNRYKVKVVNGPQILRYR